MLDYKEILKNYWIVTGKTLITNSDLDSQLNRRSLADYTNYNTAPRGWTSAAKEIYRPVTFKIAWTNVETNVLLSFKCKKKKIKISKLSSNFDSLLTDSYIEQTW